MKIVCAWCNKVLSEDRAPDALLSHGICPDCMEGLLGHSRVVLKEFLNSIDVPILLTDEKREVLHGNHAAERALGKSSIQLHGATLGVVIECLHAGVMGECGVSAYCAGCAFQRSIRDTLFDGQPRYGEYSHHNLVTTGGANARRFRYSTTRIGDAVAVAIEGIQDIPTTPDQPSA